MGASYWYLFFGGLFCCTGFGLPLGIFLIVYWFYKDFMDKGITHHHIQEQPNDDEKALEPLKRIENEIDRIEETTKLLTEPKGNIGDLHNRERYT